MQELPFVSCIMPTYNRREFVPHAIRYFIRQAYPNKELIIIDDGIDSIRDLLPDALNIKYYRLAEKITLGEKLNMACEYAVSPIIAQWDDDDWYAPRRLTYQIDELIKNQTSICGINNLLYMDIRSKEVFNYIYPHDQRTWLLGSSLCFTRDFWKSHRFSRINVGMDGLFVWSTTPDHITVLDDSTFAVHIIHKDNVSPKITSGSWWHPFPMERIREIMKDDWTYYQNGKITADLVKKVSATKAKSEKYKTKNTKKIQNIFACLVHENNDCVIDLVRNLHHHDPSSKIILYNGGNNEILINTFPYEQFNTVVHPAPSPQKYGYLHGFAFDCMRFAIDNFSFDTLTIVDSDQLCIHSGYSDYLTDSFSSLKNIGLLSSSPQRILPTNKTNYVALQAYKEYELWKPFLRDFPNGEDQFVYWTFWPATVLTNSSIRDIIKLFDNNKKLQKILNNTKIWAFEEVLFPTLVKLLGYEIMMNPCSYDYVKYKVNFNNKDLNAALNRNDVYWMHPVERKYDNIIRKSIRHLFQHYTPQYAQNQAASINNVFSVLKILDEIKSIEGWLTEKEADLLISVALRVCSVNQDPIVEIGSYHGKATVVLGSVLKAFFPESRIYAIDPHDGILGATDQGLSYVKPSFESFKTNIQKAGLSGIVQPIMDHPKNVNWDKQISILLIDGLHDYPNVACDYEHFAKWIKPGGYILFHDYADYYPGVKAFVNELIFSRTCNKVQIEDSLIVLKRNE